ncbi:MAG: fumarylacetoacetate hydrolase family protein [Thermoplasmataceae archaeon]
MELITNILDNGKTIILLQEYGKLFELPKSFHDLEFNQIISMLYDNIPEDLNEYVGAVKVGVPVRPSKILLPAINFRAHSEESKTNPPKKPYFFSKFSNALVPHLGNIIKPSAVKYLDYEGEIGVVIGKRIKAATEKTAIESIFGYTICNDISARDYQNDYHEGLGKNWLLGKASDTFLPTGPSVKIMNASVPDFKIQTFVNDEKRQEGYLHDMIFSFSKLIVEASRFITLEPGDMITSGTPSGVAMGGSGRFLNDADSVKITVDEIGILENKIREE